ncbi:MAG: tetratricopeptide repeat protein [Rubripirellula sp.]
MLDPIPAAQPYMQDGAAKFAQQDFQGARIAFESALGVQPNLTPAKFNLAVMHRELEENQEAEKLFREVIESGEILPESYNNLGILDVRAENYEQGVANFREAIRLHHDFPLAHFNLGTLLLRMEQWDEGWREYEWRWQTPTFVPVECPQPIWDGQPLDGTLLLHTEQGIGDVFQFARFLPLIRQRCKKVIFLRPEPLACMFDEADWADEIRSPGEIRLDSFDALLPLMSAPRVLQSHPRELPIARGYLTPAQRTLDLGAVSAPTSNRKVGITWAGSPTHVNDSFRSTALETFQPLFEVPDVTFYSLQIGPKADELSRLPSEAPIIDLRDQQRDFADTAAIVRELDLVITVDTSLLHLCGGMDLPAWGLLSRRSDWRWLETGRCESDWYPSVRLFRQARLNDWSELMSRVSQELQRFVKAE